MKRHEHRGTDQFGQGDKHGRYLFARIHGGEETQCKGQRLRQVTYKYAS
jgi:hypothetical protein